MKIYISKKLCKSLGESDEMEEVCCFADSVH